MSVTKIRVCDDHMGAVIARKIRYGHGHLRPEQVRWDKHCQICGHPGKFTDDRSQQCLSLGT